MQVKCQKLKDWKIVFFAPTLWSFNSLIVPSSGLQLMFSRKILSTMSYPLLHPSPIGIAAVENAFISVTGDNH